VGGAINLIKPISLRHRPTYAHGRFFRSPSHIAQSSLSRRLTVFHSVPKIIPADVAFVLAESRQDAATAPLLRRFQFKP